MSDRGEKIYNEILKDVEKMVGDKTTYMDDLNKAGKKLLGIKFRGVFASNHIPRLNDLTPYCILNLDKSTEPGSHWVALAKTGDNSILFDSFGRDHKQILPNLWYSGNGRIFSTEDDPEQKITEENCGAHVISFLVFLDKYGPRLAMYI